MTNRGTVQPPALPGGFVDSPVTLHEAQTARTGVQGSGHRLQLGVKLLIAYNALSVVLALVGPFWVRSTLPGLVESLGGGNDLQDINATIPGWLWPLMAVLSALMPAVNIWALLVAQRAVRAVQEWTLEPTPQREAAAVQSLRTLLPWVTLGQWAPLIFGVVMVLFSLLVIVAVGIGSEDLPFQLLSQVFSLIPLAVMGVLMWLLLAAVKRWMDAVTTRAVQTNFPVRPFARSLDSWLIFLLVIVVLGLLNSLVGVVMLAAFPTFMTFILNSDPTSQGEAEFMKVFAGWMQGFAWVALLGTFSYVLMGLLVYWFRQFTGNVARVLDAARPGLTPPTGLQASPVNNDW